MGGKACCTLNYLADSNEQAFMLLSAPDTDFSCLWTGSFLRAKDEGLKHKQDVASFLWYTDTTNS